MARLLIQIHSGVQNVELVSHNAIGRHPSNRIQIPDPSVSKRHAVITIDRYNMCMIEDISSKNGTFVNKRRIKKKTVLYDGNEIKIGKIRIHFKAESKHAAQMIEIDDKDEWLPNTTLSPQVAAHFPPEQQISDEDELRSDYEKLRVTYELLNEMNLARNINKTLDRILKRTHEFLAYDQGVILMTDNMGRMIPHSYKTNSGVGKFTVSSTLVSYVKNEKKGVISTDVAADQRFNVAESILLEGVKSTIAVPILADNELLGIMILYSLKMTNAFTRKDLGLITAIANLAAHIIRNTKLHDELKRSFDSSLRTLSATVDARHPLTAGHSERVTEVSTMVASQMGFSEEEIEKLKFAALMHDIGKIGIPDHILLKNGRYTRDEKSIMDTHPAKTKDILDNFYFPEALKSVPLIAASHHEKINGSGYPLALKGEQIPIAARILAVADVFDALTARRDYPKYVSEKTVSHDPLPLEDVIKIIKDGKGSQFDPSVVDAFLKCLPAIISRYKGVHFPQDYDMSISTKDG